MELLVREEWEHTEPSLVRRALDSVLVQFALLPDGFDTSAAIAGEFREQRRSVYLSSKRMVALPRGATNSVVAQALVHELVHALQDERHAVGPRLKYQPGEGDRIAALSALAEGEALHVEADLAALEGTNASIAAESLQFPDVFAESIRPLPLLLRRAQLAPYIDGFNFVRYLRRTGGLPLVDWVWNCTSLGTDDLLHPERWVLARERHSCPPADAEPVRSEQPPWTAGAPATFFDVLGESTLRLILAESLSFDDASNRASAYATDGLTSFEVSGWRTVLWHIRVRSAHGLAPLCEGLTSALGGRRTEAATATSCWVQGRNSLAVACSGRDIRVLGRGPTSGRLSVSSTPACLEMAEWLGGPGAGGT
ncbi:MAG: hypothetical protein QM784_34340 [Polyangiaceae bacterium]